MIKFAPLRAHNSIPIAKNGVMFKLVASTYMNTLALRTRELMYILIKRIHDGTKGLKAANHSRSLTFNFVDQGLPHVSSCQLPP